MINIGIIGNTGRMGQVLTQVIKQHHDFSCGAGFSRSQKPYVTLQEVFSQNNYVVDFSKPELLVELLQAAIANPKPLVICTTGWAPQEIQPILMQLAAKVPVVVASNTSVGAYLQRYLVQQLANILGEEYDIDILEKHHRHKVDNPSGTATSLLHDIQAAKKQQHGIDYKSYPLEKGPRPEHFIGTAAARSGNLPGDHTVSFVSAEEMICVQHVAFDRALFAKGAVRIVKWLETTKPKPGLYSIQDVLNLK